MTLPREFADPLRRLADGCPLAARVVWHAQTGSTNADLAALADAGAPEGCVTIADEQTAGRGRLGRSWSSPAGSGIYASVLFRPDPGVARLLTIAAGVAVAEAIETAAGIVPLLKWPNDVYLAEGSRPGRKVAGILAEAGVSRGQTWVVIGFGINVLPTSFPPDLAARATSLESELGRPVDRGELFATSLVRLSTRYDDLRGGRGSDVIAAWRRRASSTFGRRVEWDEHGVPKSGVVLDIDDEGGLMIETAAGSARVVSGEVRWL